MARKKRGCPVDIAVLFREIHAVNPTDRGLPPAEQAARYARKAALQSQLIDLHGEVLEVAPDPNDEDLVSIRHTSGQRDAAHARVSALDDDARAWVRDRLAQAPRVAQVATGPAPAPRPVSPAALDLLAAGRRALDDYDFDEARRCFQAAVAAAPGAPAPLLALVELLVDHLHEVDPGNADRLRLGERLSAKLALGHQPREDALRALVADGRWDQALAEAQALLRDWPGSGPRPRWPRCGRRWTPGSVAPRAWRPRPSHPPSSRAGP